ncbi:Dimeric alpha-beta barrel [Niveomyces insectorum RCEF 264]|uniref:Dimeric alpha-beta barrel n=1 Tax=Niveomyces insectorum RCEF 264 TaxID=1081102 RepID=A0A167Q968_9HYPO|nr:Dimeric alpha-beta barrel [Niveomyces insectorum RCEF 264]
MALPGMLFVAMEPKPGLSLDEFHEWYNNEHGPTRLKMPYMFPNGQRFRATDGIKPTFLATYDVPDLHLLATPVYTNLRAHRTPREAGVLAQVDVQRHLIDLQSTRQAPHFVPYEQRPDDVDTGRGEATVLIFVEVSLTDAPGAEDALVRWYEEEHIPLLAKVPGWLRTRRYRTNTTVEPGSDKAPLKLYTLHEYSAVNGLGGPEHKASMSTTWRAEVFAKYVADKGRRAYELFYTFASGPRDLAHLARLPPAKAFVSADGKTRTTPPSDAATDAATDATDAATTTAVLESYVTTPDGLQIPYRLEGNPAPGAPTVAFANSLLTSLHMWDSFVALLRTHRPAYRILRYDQRGRHAIPSPPVPATVAMLADDLRFLLQELRIPQLHALVGVSLGGATTLQFALAHPDRVARYVACDFNIASAEANTAAWKERIALAETPRTADGVPGMQALAVITVPRWLHPATLAHQPAAAQTMTEIVATNDLVGFKYGCQALWNFDMRAAAKDCRVPGLLVVGEGDGKGALAKAMDGFRGAVGPAPPAALKVVPDAGHLPMFENPAGFWASVQDFL